MAAYGGKPLMNAMRRPWREAEQHGIMVQEQLSTELRIAPEPTY